jgi:hypothetical protein
MADVSKLMDELSGLTVLEAMEPAKLLKDKWQISKVRQQAMVSVADIKSNLLGWPDEVVEGWLQWFANDICWAPPEQLGDHRWSSILGGRPLAWWKKVSWKKEIVTCEPTKLSDKSRAIVIMTIAQINNRTADAETQRRFKRAMDYILDNGVFPGAIVAMNVPSGLTVLDGNHRVSAFCGVQLIPDAAFERLRKKRPSLQQEVWVGTHAGGEVPLT